MSFPLLALFTRSLREDARGAATYWARGGLGAFVLLVLAFVGLTNFWTGAPGRTFFAGLVSLQAIAITFLGLSFFASAITEEKEEQTLGLLRMTDLSPLSILLGKSTSRLCTALLLLAAAFPFMFFAVTLGGVSLRQIAAVYATFGAYLFLLGNVALLGSVLARRTTGAAVFTVVTLGLLFSAGPLLGRLHTLLLRWGWPSRLDELAGFLWKITPLARLEEILNTGFFGAAAGWQVSSSLVLGAIAFLGAWGAFHRFGERSGDEASLWPGATRLRAGVLSRRPPRPWAPALIWKDFYFLSGGRLGMIARLTIYGTGLICAVLAALLPSGTRISGMLPAFAAISGFLFTIDLATSAGRLYRSEISGQTLSALAVLPVSMRQIVRWKSRAFLLALAPGLIFTLVAGPLQLFARYSPARAASLQLLPQLASSWMSLLLLVHLVVWLSLSMKRGAWAVGYVANTTLQIFITFSSLFLTKLALSLRYRSPRVVDLIYVTPALGCLVSLLLIMILRRRSLRQLEALAGEN